MSRIADRKAQLQAIWSDTTWDDVACYIGPNAGQFRATWEKQRTMVLRARGSSIVWSMCWPALFLSFAWFFYRKQWLLGAILIALPALILALFPIPAGAFGGVGIGIAMMAKSLYLQDIMPRIAELKATRPDDAAALVAAGGVSLAAGSVSSVLLAAAVIASAVTAFG